MNVLKEEARLVARSHRKERRSTVKRSCAVAVTFFLVVLLMAMNWPKEASITIQERQGTGYHDMGNPVVFAEYDRGNGPPFIAFSVIESNADPEFAFTLEQRFRSTMARGQDEDLRPFSDKGEVHIISIIASPYNRGPYWVKIVGLRQDLTLVESPFFLIVPR